MKVESFDEEVIELDQGANKKKTVKIQQDHDGGEHCEM